MTQDERRRAIPFAVRAALASVAMAALLLVLKGWAAWASGSVAMLGSLADTGLDLLASLVTLYGVRLAALPADHDHRYGHGKAEALAALFQVMLITASAIAIAWRAVLRLGDSTLNDEAGLGIGVSLLAIAATVALLGYQRSIIRRTGSVAIMADNVHYQSDLLVNVAVILALVLDQYLGVRGADPLFGIGIAAWLAFGAVKASTHAIDMLMDKEWPEEQRAPAGAEGHPRFPHPPFGQPRFRAVPHGGRARHHSRRRARSGGEHGGRAAARLSQGGGADPPRSRGPRGYRRSARRDGRDAALVREARVTRLRFTQVDAFADRPFAGNPAAVMPLDAWLPDATLQAIAAENNLSETAFLVADATGGADYELRWFTPATEVVLCGHATLASGHVILSADPQRELVRFRTRRAGPLSVTRAGDGYELALPVWRPEPRPLPDLVAGLGVSGVVATLWHEHRYALVVVDDEAEVRACRPDFRALAADGDVLTIVSARGRETDIVSRAFVPGGGVDEDPVTGSAHTVLLPYWCAVLGRDRLTCFQASARGGYLDGRLEQDRVVLRGACVSVIEGTFLLP